VLKIKDLRKQKGISQRELAEQMNVSRSSVAMWERGTEPSNEMIQRLANYFGVTVDALFGCKKNDDNIFQQIRNDDIIDGLNALIVNDGYKIIRNNIGDYGLLYDEGVFTVDRSDLDSITNAMSECAVLRLKLLISEKKEKYYNEIKNKNQ